MIQANQWYNIAVSNLTPSSTNVKLTIGIRQVNFNVSVDWGNILLTITQSVIVDIKISLRVRNLGEYFYIDVRSDTTSEDIISASLYDNNYWNIVSPAPAGSGETICIINDISEYNPETGGGSSSGDLILIQKELIVIGERINNIEDWFTLRTLTDGRKVLYTKYNIAAAGDISAGGISEESDVPTGTATTLGGLLNVDSTADDIYSIDKILVKKANETHYSVMDLSEVVGLDEDALSKYLTTNSYATHSWVEQQGYLTEHQDISGLLSKAEATNTYATQAALGTLQTAHDTLRNEFNALEALLSDDTAGVIDTWNDVKAFLDGYSESEDLATILSKMNAQIDLKANQSDVNTILDWFTLRTLTDGRKVLYTKYNIAAAGDISAGGISEDIGSGEGGSFSRLDSWDDYNPANGDVLSAVLGYGLKTDIQSLQEQINNMGGGGLSSITVNIGNTAYDSVDGVVSLPSYPVVPTLLSEFTDDVVAGHYLPVEGGYFTNSLNYKSTSAYPLILGSTYGIERCVILLRHNDVNKAQVGWTDDLGTYLYNYVSQATLGINNNGVAYFNDYTLYHSGNFDPADYLPKSGGTITDQLYFEPTSKYISLRKYGVYNAGIGYDTAGHESVVLWASNTVTRLRWHAGIDLTNGIAAGTVMNITPDFEISKASGEAVGYIAGNTIIHSGNIGSQSVAKARSLYDFGVISTVFNANTSLSGGGRQSNYDNIALWGDSVPSGMQYGMIYQLQGYYQDGNALAGQLAWDVNHLGEDSTRNLWWRANDSTAFANAKWHQIAFTDSNVASATKLQTTRTIWGRSFDGTQDLSGALTIANNAGGINIKDTAGTSRSVMELNAGNNLFFGYSTAGAGYHSYYCGNALMFLSGTSRTEAMRIQGSGNVVIGTTTDRGYKLAVNGTSLLSAYKTPTQQPTLGNKGDGTYLCVGDTNFGLQIWSSNDGSSSLQAHRFDRIAAAYSLKLSPLGGNVLIGTTTDDGVNKLQVNGNISATGSIIIGGATLTWDATYNCLRVNTNLATDGELTAGGVSDDSTDTGVSYNRLDSWDAYNAGAGDVLSATLGYGLKMNIETIDDRISNLQSQIDALGSGSGGSVSGDYLPLTGGTLIGSITVKGTNKGYMWARESDGAALGRLETDGTNLRFRDYNQLTSGGSHTIITHQNIGDYAISNTGGEIYGDLYTYANITSEAAIVADFISGNSGGEFSGDVYIAANLFVDGEFNYSDMRYKDVLEDIYIPNDVIADAPIFRYRWADKFDNKLHIGTSAQYWEEYDNTLVSIDPRSGKLGLNYISLAVAMGQSNANEIRELKKEIVKLKERLAAYEQ